MDGAAEDGVHCTPYSSAVAVATSLGWRVELEPDVLAELSARWALSGHRGAEHLDAVLSALAAPPSEMTCRYDPSAFAGGVSEATKSLEMEMANVEEDVTGSGAAGAVAHAMTTSCAKDNDVSDCTSASTLAAEEIALPDKRRWSATPHAVLEDVLTVPCAAVPRHGLVPESKQVLVSHLCAMAVLRGADVFAPGVLAVSSDVQQGDAVSIWADMDGACVRGTIAETFIGRKVFVGNAVATLSRIAFFRQEAPSGVYAKVTDPLFPAPRFSGSVMFALQNVPSCAVAHELDVEPGHAVIDMCAAPGGKTAHVATLMRGRGKLVALDRSARRAEDLAKVLASRFPWVDVRKMDASKCLGGEQGFPAATFDRVLLDAPCTGLGQRPRLRQTVCLKDLLSTPRLQRKLLATGAALLRPGGLLVYSTCTISPLENEAVVAWAVGEGRSHLGLELIPPSRRFGGPGLKGQGLSDAHCDLVQRFDPSLDNATIGFFIARFRKL